MEGRPVPARPPGCCAPHPRRSAPHPRRRSAPARAHVAVQQPAVHSGDGDVYDSAAVLDAAYDADAAEAGKEPYVLNIEVQDVPGVLNQVRRALRLLAMAACWAVVVGVGRSCGWLPIAAGAPPRGSMPQPATLAGVCLLALCPALTAA